MQLGRKGVVAENPSATRLCATQRHSDTVSETRPKVPFDELIIPRSAVRFRAPPLNFQALSSPEVPCPALPNSCTLYSLRHSCATLLPSEGVHPKVVSERLGHASITTTLQTYAHVLPTMQEKAVEVLNRLLLPDKSAKVSG